MPIRYDDAERTITCSVRDLVAAGAPAGHLTLEVVQRRAARAAAGRQVHADWQAEQSQESDRYRSEVSLKRTVAIDDWTCVILGRVDGLHEEDKHTVVEEIKSTVLDAGRLYSSGLEDWPAFVAQLEVYLWMLDGGSYLDPVGRLVLVSIADGSTHVLGVALDLPRVDGFVRERLTQLVEERRTRLEWLARRRGRTVPQPHDTWRPGQQEIAQATAWGLEAGIAVLVEAPTGLGKTAAALYGALSYALAHDKQVFWATPRGTQQAGVVRALAQLAAVGLPLRSVRLAAKQKVCLNHEVSCRPDACRFAESYYDKVAEHAVVPGLVKDDRHLSPEHLAAVGERYVVCPFEVSLDASSHVDVVIGDYNYVFDPGVALRRHFSDDGGRDWVVVVDEVHHLAERARGYYSPQVEISLAREAAARLWAAGARYQVFVGLAQRIEGAVQGVLRGGSGEEWVFQPDVERWRSLADEVDRVGLDYALLKAEAPPSWASDDDPWQQLARQVLRFSAALDTDAPEIVPVASTRPGHERIGLLCLDPSPWLGPQIARLGGFVGLSATLRPHAFHRDLLGIPEDKLDVVSVPSPFPPEHQRVVVAPRVSTSWKDRERHAPATAQLIERCAGAVPGNVACFFPSFSMLEDIVSRSEWSGRRLVVQRPGMTDAERRAVLEGLAGSDGPPTLLAAVLGGIFAEGVDLPPGALSAVFVAGPGLPPIGLERDLLRELYEDKYGSGFAYASLVPGLTRVVQAAGRLIRRPEDRGVVLLIGRRYRHRDVRALLPDGFEETFADDPVADIQGFFGSRPR